MIKNTRKNDLVMFSDMANQGEFKDSPRNSVLHNFTSLYDK